MNDVLVLCYHAVSPTWTADLSITPDALERQLGTLVRRGYRGATFHQAVTAPPAAKVVVPTFDDAYRSVLELAAPILADLRLPGTVFVPTEWAGRDAPMTWPGIDHWRGTAHEPELWPLTWDELGALTTQGWEVGSHTESHPHLTTLRDDELATELTGSRQAVEEQLGTCRTIAYPYGDQDARVRDATRRAGYAAGAALGRSQRRGDPLSWPRVGVYHGDDDRRFALKVARPVRRVFGTRAVVAALDRRAGRS